ncbi:MAG: phospholipase D-like domain-containing protein [Casimicrobiaceae bacterium]
MNEGNRQHHERHDGRPRDPLSFWDRLGRLRRKRTTREDQPLDAVALAGLAMTRAAGGPAIEGNAIALLRDAGENFPAWKAALQSAERFILFECYIFADDALGRSFAEILTERARAGVKVAVVVDWLGSWNALRMWHDLRAAGGDVRIFNPPRLASPLGWLSRDHRKTIVVDGRVGFVSGLCVSEQWLGDAKRKLDQWRDTGIEVRGPAVAALEQAFAQVYSITGDPLPEALLSMEDSIPRAGDVKVHVIANEPMVAGTFRMDLIVASIARRHLWLTDAYFVGTTPYVQALRAAARDGVDVRLLVPGASDIPALTPLSRAQYRPLLESGVRVFEWNGTMLHAKTAVADGLWARVGSTNLNLASWMSNYELDVAIEDREFSEKLAHQYEQDLGNSTEIVLTRNRVRRAAPNAEAGGAATRPDVRRAASGSAGRAAAGAVGVGSALGAALTNRRTLGPAESGLLFIMAVTALCVGAVAAFWPRVLAWPFAVIAIWVGLAWAAKAWALHRGRAAPAMTEPLPTEGHGPR